MKCPYCHKRVADMPNHLQKSERCKEKHSKKLAAQLTKEVLPKRGMNHEK